MATLLALSLPLLLSCPPILPVVPADGDPPLQAATWPQWRGPARDGHVSGPAWPDSLDPDRLRERWRIRDLGPSYSGPIVGSERVFTTATESAEREVVTAFDRASGEVLWEASWEGAMEVPFFAARNGSWIRATPAWDGESLFVAGMRDVLVALDAETGKERWKVDFVERFGTPLPDFGFASSPLVVGDALFVQAGAALVKLDKQTGEILWRGLTDRGGMSSAFSSPVVATLGGREQLVVQTREDLCGVDLDAGALLWSVPVKTFRGMNILTPLLHGDAIFTASYGGRAQLFDLETADEALAAKARWSTGGQGYMSSPVEVDGHAYLFQRSNRFTCIDLESGEDRWTSPPTGDDYWSLVANGDRLLVLANTGRLYLIAADPKEYRVLAERELTDADTWAHLAVADRQVFVRSRDELIAYSWE